MEVNKRVSHKIVEMPEFSIVLTADDLKKIIVDRVKVELGYDIKGSDISFKTDWKFKNDEWGDNKRIVTCFDGVKILVKEVE